MRVRIQFSQNKKNLSMSILSEKEIEGESGRREQNMVEPKSVYK